MPALYGSQDGHRHGVGNLWMHGNKPTLEEVVAGVRRAGGWRDFGMAARRPTCYKSN